MTARLRIALAPLNPHPGALEANAARILAARAEAASAGAELLLTPEFSLTAAPLHDLALDPAFLEACDTTVAKLAEATADGGPGLVVGAPWRDGDRVFDAAFLLDAGRVAARRARHAPGDAFCPGPAPGPVAFRGIRLGLMLGQDAASPEVAETLWESGAEILIAPGAFPFEAENGDRQLSMAVARVVETGLPLILLNLLGAQDGFLFSGGGFALNADRSLAARLPEFSEAVLLTDWQRGPDGWACAPQALPPAEEALPRLYRALTLGLRDHVQKGGFDGVVPDVSPGPGPALATALALDALGPAALRPVGAERALRLNGVDKTAMALGEVSPAGDLAPLGDVWRGTVLALARWRAIPEDALSGADERLDVPLKALLERGEGDPALRRRLHAAEPQRRRAPPLIKISADAFGLDRRYPLTNAFSAEAPTA